MKKDNTEDAFRPERGRFAPSPSGRMHLGNLFSCLLAWLDARSAGGMMTLRMEDLDPDRCRREYALRIADDLNWLGLDWDEGWDGSETGEVFAQSARTGYYKAAFALLDARGLVYPCYCSRSERLAAAAPHAGGEREHVCRCAGLTPGERTELEKGGRRSARRIAVPDETVSFTDGHYGPYTEHLSTECGDFILRRSDGVYAYQLAVTVDDALMGITRVVRGRAVRFSAQLGFEIEETTAAAVRACAGLAAHVSAERVRVEVEKTITAPFPERGGLLFSMGLLSAWLTQPASPDLSALGALPRQPLYRWSGLCVLLGGTALLKNLKPDRHTAAVCSGVVRALHAPHPETGAGWRGALALYGAEVTAIAAAVMGRQEELEGVLALKPCYETGMLALSGGELREMGLSGAGIGAAQRFLLGHVLEYPEDNTAKKLRELVRSVQTSSNSFSNRS